jgi:microcystin-dependent protein
MSTKNSKDDSAFTLQSAQSVTNPTDISVVWFSSSAQRTSTVAKFAAVSGPLKNIIRNPNITGDLKWSVLLANHGSWLLCNGASVAKATYPLLFAAIGYSFGGSGATFNLPNPTARVPGVVGLSHPMGQALGSETHAISIDELPAHTHSGNTTVSGVHDHGGATGTAGYSGNMKVDVSVKSNSPYAAAGGPVGHSHSITQDPGHTHTFSTDSTGSGNDMSLMQPTLFIGNMFIYTLDINA